MSGPYCRERYDRAVISKKKGRLPLSLWMLADALFGYLAEKLKPPFSCIFQCEISGAYSVTASSSVVSAAVSSVVTASSVASAASAAASVAVSAASAATSAASIASSAASSATAAESSALSAHAERAGMARARLPATASILRKFVSVFIKISPLDELDFHLYLERYGHGKSIS
jgi:hypothetical protein